MIMAKWQLEQAILHFDWLCGGALASRLLPGLVRLVTWRDAAAPDC
jgi:hypothetical protein